LSFYNIRDIYNLKVGDAKAKAVLLCINFFINKDTNIAFPSIATIAKHTEYSERTVYRCIKLLVDKKFLIKKKTHHQVNQYALLLPTSQVTPDQEADKHIINNVYTRSSNNVQTFTNRSTQQKSKNQSNRKTRSFFSNRSYEKNSFFSDAYSQLKDRRET